MVETREVITTVRIRDSRRQVEGRSLIASGTHLKEVPRAVAEKWLDRGWAKTPEQVGREKAQALAVDTGKEQRAAIEQREAEERARIEDMRRAAEDRERAAAQLRRQEELKQRAAAAQDDDPLAPGTSLPADQLKPTEPAGDESTSGAEKPNPADFAEEPETGLPPGDPSDEPDEVTPERGDDEDLPRAEPTEEPVERALEDMERDELLALAEKRNIRTMPNMRSDTLIRKLRA